MKTTRTMYVAGDSELNYVVSFLDDECDFYLEYSGDDDEIDSLEGAYFFTSRETAEWALKNAIGARSFSGSLHVFEVTVTIKTGLQT